MYEEYIQNYLNYPINGYRNTYDQMMDNYQYNYQNPEFYGYERQFMPFNVQNNVQNIEIENFYPEIYNVVYPMVKKVCSKNNRGISKEVIDDMVDEVYSNLETNEAITLNIVLNNEVGGQSNTNNNRGEVKVENRQPRRNNILSDLIRILILRELLRRPGCQGPNCRPGMPRPPRPNRPPYPRYDFGEM